MIEINQEALTALAAFAGMFYILMEAILKPAMKTALQRYRQKFAKEPVGDDAIEAQDELYTKRLHSTFRVASVVMGILYVWGVGVDMSFFDVFGQTAETTIQEIFNIVTTGAAIGLGSKGTHFLVDAVESVMRFSLVRLAPNETEVV